MKKLSLKIYLTKLIIVALPVIAITSCSSNNSAGISDSIKKFITENVNQMIVPKNEEVLQLPTTLYIHKDSPEKIDNNFKVNDTPIFAQELKNLKITFQYHDEHPRNGIKFKVTVSNNNEKFVVISEIGNFMPEALYLREIRNNYLGSLTLKNKTNNFKDFLKNNLPSPKNLNEWNNLLEYQIPPGFQISFEDIKTGRYDYKNNKLKIGTFSSNIYDIGNTHNDLLLSIADSFIGSDKPLYIFMVEDHGVESPFEINAEVIFLDRTTNSKILNLKTTKYPWSGKAIFGELDFSHFSDFVLEDTRGFSVNSITSIKFPKNILSLPSNFFSSNKISLVTIPKSLKSIEFDTFDKNVKFNNLENLETIGIYYNEKTNELDFSQVPNLNTLLNTLQLIEKSNSILTLEKITLPIKLWIENDININEIIRKINKLNIKTKILTFSKSLEANQFIINEILLLENWVIDEIIINNDIVSINMNIKAKVKLRTLPQQTIDLVKNGVLELNNEVLNYLKNTKNLNNYFNTGNPSKNLVKTLILEKSAKPSENNFEHIFLQNSPTDSWKKKVVISEKTLVCSSNLINTIKTNRFEVERLTPENILSFMSEPGHLNLLTLAEQNNVFVNNFYENIIFLPKLNKVTLPNWMKIIPIKAFFQIDLSNTIINLENIEQINDSAFYQSSLSRINVPKLITVGNSSFANNALIEVNSPQLQSIGMSGFQNNQITTINLPQINKISSSAFQNNKISRLNLTTLQEIDNYAFYNNLIENINLPNATIINQYSFANNKLTNINLPKVTKINNFAFYNNQITTIELPIVSFIGQSAFQQNKITTINFPQIINIETSAFWDNNLLESITLSDKSTIAKNAFPKGKKITFTLPTTIPPKLYTQVGGKKIIDFREALNPNDPNAFKLSLNHINLISNEANGIIDEVYLPAFSEGFNNAQLFMMTNITNIKKLIIMPDVFKISNSLFKGIEIEQVVGLENVREIGDSAFMDCKIQYFNDYEKDQQNIPKTQSLKLQLESLGRNAFYNNRFVELFFLPNGEKTISIIQDGTFQGSSSLRKVKIPSFIKEVYPTSFGNWSIIEREPFNPSGADQKDWVYKQGLLSFNTIRNDALGIAENVRQLNGLKIEKIQFDPSIYVIPQNFLFLLKNANSNTILDLSKILVIEENAFGSQLNISLSNGLPNIIFNDKNSGIIV